VLEKGENVLIMPETMVNVSKLIVVGKICTPLITGEFPFTVWKYMAR
jgi:hypothetical protein